MTILQFPKPAESLPQGWHAAELQQVINACAGSVAKGEASGWEVGVTDYGDPQLHLMGPPPNYECIVSISRLGRLYVLEDGNGRVVFEHDNPMLLAEQAKQMLHRRKAAIVARIAIAWCAIREAVEEKTEALMAEPLEVLTHIAPQLSALV
jgi:hypothetical protein